MNQALLTDKKEKIDWPDENLSKPSGINRYLWTDEGYMFISETKLNEIVEKKVSQKIDEIIERKTAIRFRKITKTQAKKNIVSFIKQKHEKGIFRVSVLDMVLGLELPPEQVEDIMSEFEKSKKVKEI